MNYSVVTTQAPKRLVSIFLAMFFLVGLFSMASAVLSATPAFAANDCGGALCAGIGDGSGGNITPPGATPPPYNNGGNGGVITPGPAPAPGGGGGNGGGNGGVIAPSPGSYIVRMGPGGCPVRDDGKGALAKDQTYIKQTKMSEQRDPRLVVAGWRISHQMPEGYLYTRYVKGGQKCYYPPRVRYTTIQCSIRYYVAAEKILPNRKTLGQASGTTGYSEGSMNYNACINSRGNASLRQPITEYGYYEIYTWQRTVSARVEIAYTPNEVTGVTPGPKIVSLGPAYNTSRALRGTASLDCKNGFSRPGIRLSDWTETPCLGRPGQASCNAGPINYDVGDGGSTVMRSFAGNRIQFLRDGKSRAMVFNQNVAGPGLRLNSQSTTFLRDGKSTPWKSGASYLNNQFELRASAKGASILSQGGGTSSAKYSGNKRNVWVSGIAASETGAPTKITQRINWAGTRNLRSAIITGVNANTGAVTFSPITVTVPTSGVCNQSGTVEYVRSIGDVIR